MSHQSNKIASDVALGRFKPSDIERLLGISNDVLRDRRRRSKPHNSYFGTASDSGRWSYSSFQQVIPLTPSLFEAERLAYHCAGPVAEILGLEDYLGRPPPWRFNRVSGEGDHLPEFMCFAPNQNPSFGNSVAEAMWVLDTSIVLTLNLYDVAREIPEHVLHAIKASRTETVNRQEITPAQWS